MKSLYFTILFLLFSLSFTNAQDTNWLKIITHEAGIDSARGSRVVIADVNKDNYPDLIWGTGNINNNKIGILLNIPNPDINSMIKRVFRDFTAESNINQNRDPEKTGRVVDVSALADVDNDGDLDLITSIYYHRLQMYQGSNDPGDRTELLLNDGQGHFSIFKNSGLNTFKLVDTLPDGLVNCTGLAFLDYDYDGIIDLYMSTWFYDYASNLSHNNSGYITPDLLLKGNGDGTFTLQTNSGIEKVKYPIYGVNVTDWNNDGWQDVITSPYCRSGGSLFRNNKNGTFSDVAGQANYSAQLMQGDNGQNLCQWEALPGDFDNDGDMDLLQINVHGGYNAGEGRTHVTLNQGSAKSYNYEWELDRLTRIAPDSTHISDDGGSWIDIDADTKLDVLIGQIGYNNAANGTNMQGQTKVYFLKQNADNYFNDISAELGFNETLENGHSMEPCDYDLDGIQEIFVSHQILDTNYVNGEMKITDYMQIELLENKVARDSNFISVKLDPPADCNKSAIGSRITVYSDDVIQIREVQAGNGHFAGQQPFIQNFGMSKRQIDSIVVRWPNNTLQTTLVKNPEINTIIQIGAEGKTGFLLPNTESYSLISFEKPYINTPDIDTGTTYTIAFNVKNSGNKPINVSNVSIISDENVYTLESETSFTLAAGLTKVINVDFLPTERKIYYGKVQFNSDATNEQISYQVIKGHGYAPKPLIEVDADSILFANIWKDSVLTAKLGVKNIGVKDLIFSEIKIENTYLKSFSIIGTPADTLKPGETQYITIQFKPVFIKVYSTNLIIKSNAFNATTLLVPITAVCDGPSPIISTNVGTLLFLSTEIGTTKDKVLEISNKGNAPLTISNIDLDSLSDIFLIAEHPTPLVVKKDSTYYLTVSFVPNDDLKHIVNMNLYSDDRANPKSTVILSGKGKKLGIEDDCLECNSFIVELSPNPANGRVNLNFKNVKYLNSQISMKLYDLSGRIITRYEFNPSLQPNFDMMLELPNLTNGMYYLNIQIGFTDETIPISIQMD